MFQVPVAGRAPHLLPRSCSCFLKIHESPALRNETCTTTHLLVYRRSLCFSLLRRPAAPLPVLPRNLADALNAEAFQPGTIAALSHEACCFADGFLSHTNILNV